MKKILIIDDSAEIRENACEMLELQGYEVIGAENGKLGIDSAKQHLPHLILCDIMMPEVNGYDVFTELKAHHSTKNIPFIFLTASVQKSEIEKGIGIGANAFIKKPFDEEELYDMVARFVGSE